MKLKLSNFALFFISHLMLNIMCANAQVNIQNNNDLPLFPTIEKNLSLNFPRDHGAHKDYRIEWWYLTANLKDLNDKPVGLQWTLFRAALDNEVQKTGWESSQVWMAHAAVTTENDHFFHEKFARGGTMQSNVVVEPFEAWIDDWYLKGTDWGNLTVTAKGENFEYFLKLKSYGPIVKHGDNGRSIKSSSGQASAYYSQPFFQAKGWIKHNGQTLSVKGFAWADHEWSSQFLSETQNGWDWFSLHFDSGEKLMLFQVREKEKNHFYSGTWIDRSGNSRPLDPSQIILMPVKPDKSLNYATNWNIKVVNIGIDININAINSASKMPTLYPYWEGPISFNGSHSGVGYLEMTGYLDEIN